LSFVNNAFPDRMGWKEVVIIADGVSLEGEYSTTSLSNRLTNYPEDLLTSPPDQRRVDLEIAPVASLVKDESLEPATAPVSSLSNRDDGFTKLILLEEITFPTLLLALAVSFIWGAAHAMTPGHGKTIVGAYLVGSRGTIKHAVYLGITTTVTHTIGVFALGLITLFAAQYVVPEKLFPWLSLLSGLFVVGIGFNLFVERFRSSAMGAWFRRVKSNRLRFQPAFSPTGQGLRIENSERKQSFVLAPRHQHPHDDGQHHSHDHHETAGHHHDHNHEHAHHHGHDHSDHSHQPPEEITWRSLLALGVSGGLLPCPSALVVLLGAIALNKIGFGLILVLAFSLGLAGALTAIGVAFLYAGKLFERFPASGRVIGILPAFSALFISLIGLGIVIKAAMEIGVV
jgi:ABC-type nickel/cobalt efflux system permease component RcnA